MSCLVTYHVPGSHISSSSPSSLAINWRGSFLYSKCCWWIKPFNFSLLFHTTSNPPSNWLGNHREAGKILRNVRILWLFCVFLISWMSQPENSNSSGLTESPILKVCYYVAINVTGLVNKNVKSMTLFTDPSTFGPSCKLQMWQDATSLNNTNT